MARAKATPKKEYDYSGLEVGMRVQAESEGVYYAAGVVAVASGKKRSAAPVKVHFLGYDDSWDAWLGGERLRSKAVKTKGKDAQVAKDGRGAKKAAAAAKATPKVHSVRLSNGVEMPVFGFGCAFGNWTDESQAKGFTPEDGWSAFPMALAAGIRHFDGAHVYRTSPHLGATLGKRFATGSLQRSDVFITTKVFHPPVKGLIHDSRTTDMLALGKELTADLTRKFEKELDDLGLGYVDLLLVHWPGKFGSTEKGPNRAARKLCWDALESFYESGMAKAIGVSNWTEVHLAELLEDGAKVTPMVNQVEMSPYTVWDNIVKYCKDKSVVIQAYSPLGSSAGGCLKDPVIVELAEKYKKNAGQLVLRWLVQQGIVVLPRSASAERIKSNMDIFDFEIAEADMAKITALNKNKTFTNQNPYDIP